MLWLKKILIFLQKHSNAESRYGRGGGYNISIIHESNNFILMSLYNSETFGLTLLDPPSVIKFSGIYWV